MGTTKPVALLVAGLARPHEYYTTVRGELEHAGYEVRGITLPKVGFDTLDADAGAVWSQLYEAAGEDVHRPIVVAAHSKGGRAGAVAIDRFQQAGWTNVQRLITFGTPWRGVDLLQFGVTKVRAWVGEADAMLGAGMSSVSGRAKQKFNLSLAANLWRLGDASRELGPESRSTQEVGDALARLHGRAAATGGFEHHNAFGMSLGTPLGDDTVSAGSAFLPPVSGVVVNHPLDGPTATHSGIVQDPTLVAPVLATALPAHARAGR